MKKALFYIATTLYSNAQAVRASVKKARYAIFAFIASSLMLLAPVSISKVATSGESLAKQFTTAEFMLHDFILDISEEGITCQVKNGKFTCDKGGNPIKELVYHRTYKENEKAKEYKYVFVLLDENYNYGLEDLKEEQENDNIVYFGEETFFIRRLVRNSKGEAEGNVSIKGGYGKVGTFNFEDVVNQYKYGLDKYSDAKKAETYHSRPYFHSIFSDLLYAVSVSDFTVVLVVWLLLAVIVNLICIVSGGFVLNFGNKKGSLGDEYGFKGSVKIACNLLLLPTILSVLVGLILPESVIITSPIIFFIRVFLIYRAQFTRKGQKLAIKTKKGLEDLI